MVHSFPYRYMEMSKLACEGLISAYCNSFGIKGVIVRLANVIGLRSQHGILFDFIKKLKDDPISLEILGDGSQNKSYIHIHDCISAIMKAYTNADAPVNVYNVGSSDRIPVRDIADIVISEMGLNNVNLVFTGGIDGGRGWLGDVKGMLLNNDKLRSLSGNQNSTVLRQSGNL